MDAAALTNDSALVTRLVALLSATTLALVAAAVTGRRAQRRAHLGCVATAASLFVATVVAAEQLGRACTFDATALAVHLVFANAATAALLAIVVTGVIRLRSGRAVRAHRASVVTFAVLLLLAVGTGTWMLGTRAPRASQQPKVNATTIEATWLRPAQPFRSPAAPR